MRHLAPISLCIVLMNAAMADGFPGAPAHTYSIVARDAATGQMGVAVQTHWFGVREMVAWAEAGVGAVATQAATDPSYGPLGLALMRAGEPAPRVLEALLTRDEGRETRQVGMVDATGSAASHTGSRAIAETCQHVADGIAVQANLMARSTVCAAMVQAYESADGDLADRLLAALQAAQAEGGDIRGQQSAALVVVDAEPAEEPWNRHLFDLRVDDHPAPVDELERLLVVARAYQLRGESERLLATGQSEAARDAFEAAVALLPDNHEFLFWRALGLVEAGEVDEALVLFAQAFRLQPAWRTVIERLPATGLLPDDPALMRRILEAD
jgi:uncharacterized Ntn-hydrolase superfamily protein